jgi:hypothetical protein
MLIEVPPRTARLRLAWPTLVFAAVIAAMPVFEIASGFRLRPDELSPSREDLLTGVAAQRVERALADRSSAAEAVRPRYNEALWVAFRKTTRNVVVGTDRWLFLADEVLGFPPDGAHATVRRHADLIATFEAWLATQGAALLVLPVPNKASMHPEKSGLVPPPGSMYGALVAELAARGTWHVDVRPALDPALGSTWLANDTHWSSFGACNVARLAARAIQEALPGGVPGNAIGGRIDGPLPRSHRGDLHRMLGFAEGSAVDASFLVRAEWHAGAAARGSPAGPEPQPVVLCGTSFSHSLQFAALLGAALDRRVTDLSVPGRGPTVTLLELARAIRAGTRTSPRVIVWEFPEKHMFLRRAEFLEPLGDFVAQVRAESGFDAASARLLDASHRRAHGLDISFEDEASLRAHAATADPSLVYELDEPLPGDGTVALSFVVRSPRPSVAKVYIDRGRGFVEEDARSARLRGGAPERVTVALDAPRPITRVRIDPVNVPGAFEMSAPRIWRRRP